MLKRFNEEEVRTGQIFTKELVDGLARIRVQVHRVNKDHIMILLREILHGNHQINISVTEIFATETSNQHQLLAAILTRHVITSILHHFYLFISKSLFTLQLVNQHVEGINNGVTVNKDLSVSFLLLQVLLTYW